MCQTWHSLNFHCLYFPNVNRKKTGGAKTAKKAKKSVRVSKHSAGETKPFLEAFGNHLRKLREKEGLSQGQLAFETGLSRTTVNRIEKGHYETGIASLFILATALDTTVAELMDF